MQNIVFCQLQPSQRTSDQRVWNNLMSSHGIMNYIVHYLVPQGNVDSPQEFFFSKEKEGRKLVFKPTIAWYESKKKLQEFLCIYPHNLVVAMGEWPLRILCGVEGLGQYTGSVLESNLILGQKVLIMPDPIDLLATAQWQDLYLLTHWLGRALKECKFPEIVRESYDMLIEPSPEQFDEFMEYAMHCDRWAFDIETAGNSITCWGIAVRTQDGRVKAMSVVPFTHHWKSLQQLINVNPRMVGQYLNYDLGWMPQYGISVPPSAVLMDTAQAHHYCHPELSRGLDFLTAYYLDMPYYKHERLRKDRPQTLWEYNCKDVVATLRVSYQLEKELKQKRLDFLYQTKGKEHFALALEMQREGLFVDADQHTKLKNMLKDAVQQSQKKLDALTGEPLNVGSPQQVAKYLYEKLGLPKQTKRGGGVTTDDEALEKLRMKCPHVQELLLILTIRRTQKALSSYIGLKFVDDIQPASPEDNPLTQWLKKELR